MVVNQRNLKSGGGWGGTRNRGTNTRSVGWGWAWRREVQRGDSGWITEPRLERGYYA